MERKQLGIYLEYFYHCNSFVFEHTEKQYVGKKWYSAQVGEFPLRSPSLNPPSALGQEEGGHENEAERTIFCQSLARDHTGCNNEQFKLLLSGKKYNLRFHKFIKQLKLLDINISIDLTLRLRILKIFIKRLFSKSILRMFFFSREEQSNSLSYCELSN